MLIFVTENNQMSGGEEIGIIRPPADAAGIVKNVSSAGFRLPSIGLRIKTPVHYKFVTQQIKADVYKRVRRESDLQAASPGVCVLARDNRTGDANTRFYAQHEACGNCTQPDDVFYGWPVTESTCKNITAFIPTCIYHINYDTPQSIEVAHCDLPIPWQMPGAVYVDRTLLVECGVISSSSNLHTVTDVVPFLEAPCPAVLQTDTNLVLPPMLQNISYNRHWIPSCQIIHHFNWTYGSRFCLREENSPILYDDGVGETSYTYDYMSELQCNDMMNHAVCLQWNRQKITVSFPYSVCQNILYSYNQTTTQRQDLVARCVQTYSARITDVLMARVVIVRAQILKAIDCYNIMNIPIDNAPAENDATSSLVHMAICPIGVLINALGLLVICRQEFRHQQTYARVTEFFVSNMINLTIPWTYCVINIGKIGITNTVFHVCKVGLIATKITTSTTYIAFLVLVVERCIGTCRPRLYPAITMGKLMAVSMFYMWLKVTVFLVINPDGKVRGAYMGPIWGRQNPGGPHVGPMNFAIWERLNRTAREVWNGLVLSVLSCVVFSLHWRHISIMAC